ncbi:growth arrest and DNA damage-inducible proteins-interacting protein 1 isoform X2 [Poecilia formosa]|nr:PREDICTED: growth arrest and DNA damage-inducible proteins-interacting protein 1 isoform X2 [Poecilia formosa]XP_016516730.1 PREDICTED: growth arrest and DNA damage-inducible proteins-interacting protein 1 isoform X2 [Poecilia formosa]XP_016516731.1 PREDICTED: growth arrest and DNA damage-inducible proteins-interacting protein 1 isoform X2 [Poecilia formosa]
MAASMLVQRTAALCGTLKGASLSKAILPVNCRCGFVLQTASYNPKRLWLNLRDPYIPDKDSDKTPEWQKTSRYDRKLFGRYGSASGVPPASLWPSSEELEKIIAEEKEWHPPLEVMLKKIEARQQEETEKRLAKEKLIAANMAKMPKMVEDWRREKREAKQKLKEEKERKAKLLAEAQERFGYKVDPRSPKFLEMVAEIEKEEKKKRKLLKRRQKEAQAAAPPAAAPPAAQP